MAVRLPPTSPALLDASHRPYFLWWTDATVGDLRARLQDADPDVRAYWMGALLREANTRDVWLFVTPEAVRASWDRLQRHLGRSRAMWAYLLGLPDRPWPPAPPAVDGIDVESLADLRANKLTCLLSRSEPRGMFGPRRSYAFVVRSVLVLRATGACRARAQAAAMARSCAGSPGVYVAGGAMCTPYVSPA